ncbi:endonuclease III domain-containing protein [Desulfobulbus alkaliphilus]|uniref:endonuclease III domain-containing protein n=1 Tax=Desulfobulbus alkaliphilus TaxID=869814 RepID=UPI001964F838|nr:endonuclease III domain-containing protein [Desulfobulbus alkaliphilus]MBM9537851.1 endonuclease III domain-containing protein [Desulfobulbus alkaliphilus]
MRTAERLQHIYDRMFERFGPQHWWPAETPFEVMVGAVLTQNTSWRNVERAITNLREVGLLSFEAMAALPTGLLAEYIRPAGYYNVKARRLGNLLSSIKEQHNGDLAGYLGQPLSALREQLLAVKGIGPETADSILLYAASHPVFVVDAYTHRILCRHDLIDEECGYHELQDLFMDHLPADTRLYNEYHALLVRVGSRFCKKKGPDCEQCPLQGV